MGDSSDDGSLGDVAVSSNNIDSAKVGGEVEFAVLVIAVLEGVAIVNLFLSEAFSAISTAFSAMSSAFEARSAKFSSLSSAFCSICLTIPLIVELRN